MDRKISVSVEETADYGFILRYTVSDNGKKKQAKYIYKINMQKTPANCATIADEIKTQLADIITDIIKRVDVFILHSDWDFNGFSIDGYNATKYKNEVVRDD